MDIVDTQVHFGPGGISETLAAMDALGIRAVLIDESWPRASNAPLGRDKPGYDLPDGSYRMGQPTAELAALTHPERFSYVVRVDRRDPGVETVIRLSRDKPPVRAIRTMPGLFPSEREAFAAGAHDALCAAVCDSGLPFFIFASGGAGDVARYARKFPSLKIVVDHCGVMVNRFRAVIGGGPPQSREAQIAAFDEVLALADLPNVALKWAHAPGVFEAPAYPGDGLWPVLRKAVDRFGADRVMWASDATVNATGETWAELLFGVRGAPNLSQAEREAVLGGTARKWLDWPA